MTYNVSRQGWVGPTLMAMGVAHLALGDWRQLTSMARRGWWATAGDAVSGQTLWFAVAGGALIAMGSFACHDHASGRSIPRVAAASFTITVLAAFTATTAPGAGVGTMVGMGMCASAFRSPSR